MPSEAIVKSVQQAYKSLKESLPDFEPRSHQNYLVGEVTKAISGDNENNIIVAEAGTGTGKSLGYLMAAIPVAKHLGKHVVVSTATVALQEQLIDKDLPFYRDHIEHIDFDIAKGKGRYCCVERLQGIVTGNGDVTFDFKPTHEDREVYKKLFADLKSGEWKGDRDSLKKPIEDKLWNVIASGAHTCKGKRHVMCPFHIARRELSKANVIVANHALVAADLSLGGGIILPEQDNTIYVFDEAHHLPNIIRDAHAGSFSLSGSTTWVMNLYTYIERHASVLNVSSEELQELAIVRDDFSITLDEMENVFKQCPFTDKVFRFKNGEISSSDYEKFNDLKSALKKLRKRIGRVRTYLEENEESFSSADYDQFNSDINFHYYRLENIHDVTNQFLNNDETPLAKWLTITEDNRVSVHSSLLDASETIKSSLLDAAHAVVMTSATLSTLGNFEYFKLLSGVPDESKFIRLSSPFDYPNNAELLIPQMNVNPSSREFTNELIEKLSEYLFDENYDSHLVLFSSYKQMNEVADQLKEKIEASKITFGIQGKGARNRIISKHKEAIDKGGRSILFGTQGFSEGLDLKGKYLTQLVVTKIPFSVPTEPIDEAYAELVSTRGGNPFMEISVPEASRKMIQSVGRLIRTKRDTGRCIILDDRIATKNYGKSILKDLPPFKLNTDYKSLIDL
ncbi:ATP-dependent helicase DinG/Rad3 (plasmid) [Vibrio vulnificus]|uniref:ATP-dependent DNA helicase DinG n=1 Tax=Vibrio vulnificus TaxID=672 RepID=UPI000A2067A8|nr:ATP-dependent DNA helicase DinG [Vibrio vulnificus]ARN69373.1 ATP-dependent helicase DinG/Rad3 [Vibrio vulnificus]